MGLSNLFKTILKAPGKIRINNNDYVGSEIYISGKRVVIDGETVQELNGNVSLDITINGNCEKVDTMNGDVIVKGDVYGNVSTMNGDVTCEEVRGKISTMSGDVIVK